VHHLAGELVRSSPLRIARGVLVPDGDDDLLRVQLAVRRRQAPSTPMAVDSRHIGFHPKLDAILAGVAIKVSDDIVAVREHRRPLGVRPIWQMRERSAGVQFQPVVATPP
jgi:hypothetical protein